MDSVNAKTEIMFRDGTSLTVGGVSSNCNTSHSTHTFAHLSKNNSSLPVELQQSKSTKQLCLKPSGLIGDNRSMCYYLTILGVLIVLCIVSAVGNGLDELSYARYDYPLSWRLNKIRYGTSGYELEKERLQITHWYIDNYDDLCENDGKHSNNWCTLQSKGSFWIAMMVFGSICWVIATTAVSSVVCCGPNGCCTRECKYCACYYCCKNCFDGNFCNGFCCKNTAVWSLGINGGIYLLPCIVWAVDNPIGQDFYSKYHVVWGVTWWSAIYMSVTYIACAAMLASPNSWKCA